MSDVRCHVNLITLALASTLVCQPTANRELVGLWESVSASKGGIGNNIELRPDGSFVAAVTVIVDLRYETRDGKLYIAKNPQEPISYETGVEFKIDNTALTLVGQNGEKEVKDRIGPKISDSVVGKYRYRHYTGGIAYEQFTADGILKFRLPMQSTHGCYLAAGKEIKISFPNREPRTLQYNLGSDGLVLTDQKAPSRYKLVKEGAWYESGNIDYKPPEQ
jgi:hypothetical protein